MTEVDPLVTKSAQQRVKIINKRGLHARASARLAKMAGQFDAEIFVSKDGTEVCATSIMGLLLLVAARGERIFIKASGPDAADAVSALASLIENRFEEEG